MRYLFLSLITVMVSASIILGLHSKDPEMREWDLTHQELPMLTIALLSDFHFSDPEDLKRLAEIKRQMLNNDIDLVLFAGDFIGSTSIYENVSRGTIVRALEALAFPAPAFAVLGNHDNWDSRSAWIDAFSNSTIGLIDNSVAIITLNEVEVCIRGLGDYFSGHFSNTQIPEACGKRVITLTHDPAGLIEANEVMDSLGLAGHTHCGQVAFPLIGAPVVPTRAPKDLHCGRFDRGYPGIVSGGLGTSIVPVRFGPGTEPGWELIRIQSLN